MNVTCLFVVVHDLMNCYWNMSAYTAWNKIPL